MGQTFTSTTANAASSYHVPWIIIGICYVACMILLFSIRVLLARENKRRDAEPRDNTYDNVYVVTIDKDGSRTEVKVSKVSIRFTSKSLCSACSSSCESANRSFWI